MNISTLVTRLAPLAARSSVQGASAALLLGISLVIGIWPLFTGSIVYEDDVTHYYLPAFHYYADALASGEDPSLAPVFSGFPLALTQVGGFLDPINHLLFSFVPFPDAYHLRIVLNYFLAGMFTYLFARSLGLSYLASLVAMFAYVTAQHIVPGANILRSNSFILMPALFYVINELHARSVSGRLLGMVSHVLLGATVIAISIVGGYTQLVLYSLIAAGLFAAYIAYQRFSYTFVCACLALAALGLLPTIPYILAVLDFVRLSYRAGGLDWTSASAGITASDYWQALTVHLVWPRLGGGTLQSLYIGTFSFLFAAAGVWFWRRNTNALFFVGLLFFSVLSAFPYPLFWLMHYAPVLNFFRFPPHWFLVSAFCLSALAAYGFDAVKDNMARRWRTPAVGVLIVLVLIINLSVPMRVTIAGNSLPESALAALPWATELIIKKEEGSSEAYRAYQLYPSEIYWFVYAKRFDLDPSAREDFNREYLQTHLTPLLWDVETVRGFDNLVPRRYDHVLSYLERKPVKEVITEAGTLVLPEDTFSLLGMMNVKYLWSVLPIDPRQLGRDAEWITVQEFNGGLPIHLYQNKHFVPRVYAPATVTTLPPERDTFELMTERPRDFSREAFIECECEERTLSSAVALSDISVQQGKVQFSAEARSGGWVVIAHSNIPGWRATIGDEEVPIHYANYIYQGILIPAGRHDVVVEYLTPYAGLFSL